jgi:hypothetical protein
MSKQVYQNMFTIASPHVGSRQQAQFDSEAVADWAAPLIAGRSGKEVMLRDDPDHPMLLKMVDENHQEPSKI